MKNHPVRIARWTPLAFGFLIGFPTKLPADEQQMRKLEQKINRQSERGRLGRAQELRYDLAREYEAAGLWGQAVRQYELLLSFQPRGSDKLKLLLALGRASESDGNMSAALEAYQAATQLAPRSWDAHIRLARAFAKVDLSSRALESYKRCIELKPRAQQTYVEIAAVYQRLGYLEQAVSYYEKALASEIRPEAYLGLADCYVQQGDIGKAQQLLQKAQTLLPKAEYDVRLGDYYQRLGKPNDAVASWERALSREPNRDDVQLKLALVYEEVKSHEKADRLFQQLLKNYPESPLVRFFHAWVLYQRGAMASARQEAIRVKEMNPTEGVRHYNDELLTRLGIEPS